MKWHLIIDVAKCNNCNNCVLAVKDEHVGNAFPGYAAPQPQTGHRWFDVLRKERGQTPMVDVAWLPVTCNQCENAPCLTKATEGAIYCRPDGIVMIDPVKAAGRKDIVGSCPYGHIWWNEERQLPQKWSFDAHLLDQGWTTPRVVQVCPTDAIEAVKCSDQLMAQRAAQETTAGAAAGIGHPAAHLLQKPRPGDEAFHWRNNLCGPKWRYGLFGGRGGCSEERGQVNRQHIL